MFKLNRRPRRLRRTAAIRDLVRETKLSPDDFVQPYFIVEGESVRNPIDSLPGQFQLSIDELIKDAEETFSLGIKAVILFGIPKDKDSTGSETWDDNGIIQRAAKALKTSIPELLVISDVCFCEYTDHGHCGVITENGELDNDATLLNLQKQVVSHAKAGVDIVAPSGMIDGMVGAIRTALDDEGYISTPILSYAAKFSSSFYGPFREAVDSSPQFGDRKAYQLDPANRREALKEVELDVEEGADIIMVKPALPYLDLIREVRERWDLPVAAYNVSGEYAMIKAASERGWLDGDAAMLESLISIKRAGAAIILTYFAKEAAKKIS
ncbi:porphobilinogen synthase [Candidatus Marinimicrobia bacterium MT.SAG.2]|nr:porphobilinogen synthase [Candidatus Marinimicrobia bacterium MT.SAG.2]